MFSATKFGVASASVALFGGFLLAGVLTQPNDDRVPVGASASATARAEAADLELAPPENVWDVDGTPDLLPGVDLATEEVEPGVYRVLSDGVRDLGGPAPATLAFGPSGELVVFAASNHPLAIDHMFVMGERTEHQLPGGEHDRVSAVVGDGGDVIAMLGDKLARFDGRRWTDLTWPNGSDRAGSVKLARDGTVWIARTNVGGGPRVAHVDDGVVSVLPIPDDGTSGDYPANQDGLAVAPDGTAWFGSLSAGWCDLPDDTKGLLRFDGAEWREADVPLDDVVQYGPVALGDDGTLWAYASEDGPWIDVRRFLLRHRGGQWEVFDEVDGVPLLQLCQAFGSRVEVDREGTLWIAQKGGFGDDPSPSRVDTGGVFAGLLSFDGSRWRQFLRGHDVNEITIGPDGSVWATSLADCTELAYPECVDEGRDGLYVITPEAVAGHR